MRESKNRGTDRDLGEINVTHSLLGTHTPKQSVGDLGFVLFCFLTMPIKVG
jgi:hypothetical protein